ncbi:hypothetical protein [Ralstonia phage phiRSL1]|uniref:Uncharacterized protein n=1 Tax=Ralstonia phage phiRSL1 TaxID=1980924 RepID=B2ZYH1_9CAUD|nr:hypothetical protein RSL1_ORF250 [Ralstonia phage phiRSL1]BAG41698.1 hypothetical protein [Ralstonia phage phiRSL1]
MEMDRDLIRLGAGVLALIAFCVYQLHQFFYPTANMKRGNLKFVLTALLVSLLIVLLAGCAPAPVVPTPPTPTVQVKTSVDIDERLLEDCKPLPRPELRTYNKEQVLELLGAWATTHDTCAATHRRLARIVRQAFNLDPVPASK